MISASSRNKVLVVDDEPGIRSLFARILQDDFDVLEAESAEEGLREFSLLKPDAVLLDLRMPGQGGMHALRSIRSMNPHTAVILVTGYLEPNDLKEAIGLGAVSCLAKPVEPKELLNVVRKGVERTGEALRREQRNREIKDMFESMDEELQRLRRREYAWKHTEPMFQRAKSMCRSAEDAGSREDSATAELQSRCARVLLSLVDRLRARAMSDELQDQLVAMQPLFTRVMDTWQGWCQRSGVSLESLVRLSPSSHTIQDPDLLEDGLLFLAGYALDRSDPVRKSVRCQVLEEGESVMLRMEYREKTGNLPDEPDPVTDLVAKSLCGSGGSFEINRAPGKTSLIRIRLPLAAR